MDTAESVSRGCFAYKGKKKVARLDDFFPKKDASVKSRLLVCQNMWDTIYTDINILHSDMNTKIFDELLRFALSSHGSHKTVVGTSAIHEIPTAALITGVNTPDHAVMFTDLVNLLKEKVTPLVSTLRAKDCPNLKTIIRKMISHFTSNPELILDDDDEAEMLPKKKNDPTTMTSLVTWYRKKYNVEVNKLSPKKLKLKTGEAAAATLTSQPPLIVVLEDMESFSPQVLQDFIVICSNYLHDLPFVLVFGIATAVAAVHRLLSNAASSLLCMEKFQAPPSTDYLTRVINKVLMTPDFPFKLGAKVFQLLLDVFLYHDFSVISFVEGLHFCLLDHYMKDSLAHLCCPEKDVKETVLQLSHAQLERLRQTPSFMKYVETCPAKEIEKLLEDDKFLKNKAVDLFGEMHEYHRVFFPMLHCLHILVTNLPKHPLGKQLRELYAVALESDVADTDGYKESLELLGETRGVGKASWLTVSECLIHQLTEDLQKEYVDSECLPVQWQVGQACVAFYKGDDAWYRARVLHILQDKIEVQYLDFGNSRTLDAGDLRLPTDAVVEVPQLCFECVFHKLKSASEDGKWPTVVLEYIHNSIVNINTTMEIMKTEENCPVEVNVILPDGTNLSSVLLNNRLAVMGVDMGFIKEQSNKIARILEKKNPFKTVTVLPEEIKFPVTVTHVELPNVMYFQYVKQESPILNEELILCFKEINSNLDQLLRLTEKLHLAIPTAKAFTCLPAPGQMCCTQYSSDDCWYRGLVVDVDENSQCVLVFYVDYGNSEDVHLHRLRVLPPEFRTLPAQAVRCKLSKLQPPSGESDWDINSLKAMVEVVSTRTVLACVSNSKSPTIEIDLFEVINCEEGITQKAYQSVLDQGLAQLTEESQLFDMAVSGKDCVSEQTIDYDADVIVEEEDCESKLVEHEEFDEEESVQEQV